jgi:hypothetical protein
MLSEDDHRPKIKKKKMRNDTKHNKSIKEKHEVLRHGASSLTVKKKNDYQEEEETTRSRELDTVAALDDAYAANNDIRKHGANNNGGGGISSWEEAFAIASKIQPDDSMLLNVNNVAPSTTTTTTTDTTGVVQISRLINSHNKAMYKNSHSSTPSSPFIAAEEDVPTTTSPRKHKRKRSQESNSNNDNDPDYNNNEDSSSLEGRMTHVPSDSNCGSNNNITTSSSSSSSVLVLVHNKSGLVYSTGVRNVDGTRLIIGKIGVVDLKKGGDTNNNSNIIIFDSHALKEMKRREEEINIDTITTTNTSTTVPSSTAAVAIFPYPTNPDDHCETPLKSYEDILPLLHAAARSFSSSSSSTLKIYDPYYCDGSVIKHLSTLGYSNVYNKKEDCYKVWQMKSSEPKYDILITNPPYSEDHIERLVTYVTSQTTLGTTKAWLLLMPTWVHKKDYYITATTANRITPFYIVPKKRYIYCPPPNYRTKKDSGVHKKSSPFISMWYCWGGTSKRNEEWMDAFFRSNNNNSGTTTTCDLARSRSALRDLRRSGFGGGKKLRN